VVGSYFSIFLCTATSQPACRPPEKTSSRTTVKKKTAECPKDGVESRLYYFYCYTRFRWTVIAAVASFQSKTSSRQTRLTKGSRMSETHYYATSMVYKVLAIYKATVSRNRITSVMRSRNERAMNKLLFPDSSSLPHRLGIYVHNNPLKWSLIALE